MMKDIDLSNVRRANNDGRLMADEWDAGFCGHCPHLHVDLKDACGKLFATIVINQNSIPKLIEMCQRAIRGVN